MKKMRMMAAALMLMITAVAFGQSKVYMTKEITPESLVKIYKALGVEAKGRVAVKISTGEGGNTHYLRELQWQALPHDTRHQRQPRGGHTS